MHRRAIIISVFMLAQAAAPALGADADPAPTAVSDAVPDGESAPIVNMASGRVIEVPMPAQPGDAANARLAHTRAEPKQRENADPVAPAKTEGLALGSPKPGVTAPSSPSTTRKQGSKDAAEPDTGSWISHWTIRTALGLALLVAMLLGLKWAATRFGGGLGLAAQLGPSGRAPQGLLEVLGRYPVSRGHSLVLLKLDRRVLLLGQSPAGFTALSELTDPEDVASVLTKAADADGASMSRRFSELLRGMERDPSTTEDDASAAPVTPRLAMRLAGAGSGGGGT
ncbi:MAG: FliO/MopB family protein [Phycisphaerales bacterium]